MGKRKEGKKKPKSIKANVTSRMNATRKLSRLGKKVKKGQAGPNTEFITRSAALRKLQITLKDFRRLCILKGVYPRVPTRPLKGADKIYYDLKDISYIANEPLLMKFREFKAFMKKIRRASGRNQFNEARRVNDLKPRLVLDHLVKERYPRFIDAVRDLDDCLCMIHLFAALPSAGRITADRTVACSKLAREWQYYVAKSHSLRHVFVSVKGIYYQAQVMGESVTWLVPHAFTQHIPANVDLRVMITFMEFYEVFFKFTLYKLYAQEGWQYPPLVDDRLDQAGCFLLAMKTNDAAGATTSTDVNQTSTIEDSSDSAPSTAVSKDPAFDEKVKSLPNLLKSLKSKKDGDDDDDDDDEEEDLDVTGALNATFSDLQQQASSFGSDAVDSVFQKPVGSDGDLLHQQQQQIEEDRRRNLFRGLTFFVNREVPLHVVQLCITACGGRISWDGPAAPFPSSDPSITHHVIDRPQQQNQSTGASREYIQPQWIFDSINASLLLPVRLYAPGAKLPPHLSPFVDDEREGYLPRYREEIQKLQVDAGVLTALPVVPSAAPTTATKGKSDNKPAKKTVPAHDVEESDEDSDDDETDDSDEGSEDEEEDDEEEEEEEEEPEEIMELPSKNSKQNQSKNNSNSNNKNTSTKQDDKKGAKGIVRKAKVAKQSEAEETHDLAVSMMSRKTKKLYDRMQHGIQETAKSVKRLEDKRRALEEDDSKSKAQSGPASKKQRRG